MEVALDGDPRGALKLLHTSGELSVPLLPNAERVEDRIHTLPDLVGADLATMISHARDLVAAAKRLKDAIVVLQPTAIGSRTTYHFVGNPKQPEELLEHLKFIEALATSFASKFQAFVAQAGQRTKRLTGKRTSLLMPPPLSQPSRSRPRGRGEGGRWRADRRQHLRTCGASGGS